MQAKGKPQSPPPPVKRLGAGSTGDARLALLHPSSREQGQEQHRGSGCGADILTCDIQGQISHGGGHVKGKARTDGQNYIAGSVGICQ